MHDLMDVPGIVGSVQSCVCVCVCMGGGWGEGIYGEAIDTPLSLCHNE